MRENKFEQQVREKMGQLNFDPVDEVWTAIDQEINKKKKRRTIFFWLPLLFGGLLLAGVYYNNAGKTPSLVSVNSLPDSIHHASASIPSDVKADSKQGPASVADKFAVPHDLQTKSSNKKQNQSGTFQTGSYAKFRSQRRVPASEISSSTGKPSDNTSSAMSSSGGPSFTDPSAKTGLALNAAANENKLSVSTETVATKENQQEKQLNDSAIATAEKKPVSDKKKSSWKLGLFADLGASNIYQAAGNNAFLANAPSNPGAVYAVHNNTSAGFAFGAGVFLGKNISPRISVSAGLNYHYYSTHIQTGNYMYGPISYPTANYTGVSRSYYTNGTSQKYTNQYHTAELPLSVQFQLNKSTKTPIYFTPGVSLGYLFATNALFYESLANVYMKNSDAMQRTQVNGSASLLLGFGIQKGEFRVGPFFQYGFTNLLKSGYGDPQHMIYGGLKLVFIPGKK